MMNQDNVNDFDLLISKFKDVRGLITATVIREKNIARSETAQYRRNLLASAVNGGYARHNGKLPNQNKYGIYFNDGCGINTVVERTFDLSVLGHPIFLDLPPRRLKTDLNIEHWNSQKEHWIDVYTLLCGSQINGKINLELLPNWYHADLKKIRSLEAREIILIYKLVKLGWSQIRVHLSPDNFLSSNNCNYNDSFDEILWARSVTSFSYNRGNIIDRPYAQLNYLRDIHDSQSGVRKGSFEKPLSQFLGSNYDWFWSEYYDPINISGSGILIKIILKDTQNEAIKKLLADWTKLGLEQSEFHRKYLNRKNDKGRNEKFEQKMLSQYLESLILK
jgi:hypothetical protein